MHSHSLCMVIGMGRARPIQALFADLWHSELGSHAVSGGALIEVSSGQF